MRAMHSEQVDGLVRGAVGSVVGLAVMGLYFKAGEAIGGRSDGAAQSEDEGPDPLEARDELDDISVVGRKSRQEETAPGTVGRIGYAKALGAHLAYGAATAGATQALKRVM